MPTFVLMTKLSPQLAGDPRGRKKVGRQWMKKVKKSCPEVKWIVPLRAARSLRLHGYLRSARRRDGPQDLVHVPRGRRDRSRELARVALR